MGVPETAESQSGDLISLLFVVTKGNLYEREER